MPKADLLDSRSKPGDAVRRAMRDASATLRAVVAKRLRTNKGRLYGPRLLEPGDLAEIADAAAVVTALADLWGRYRTRQRAPGPAVVRHAMSVSAMIASPEAALKYFLGLEPSIAVDTVRFGEFHARQAFTIAQSVDETVTKVVRDAVAQSIEDAEATSAAAARIDAILDVAGLSSGNPQYSEMVYRTNAMDAYNQGHYEEARAPDLRAEFPVWQYLGIKDGRQGKDHEPKFDRYYPAAAPFADVRGPRPWNCRCTLRWVTADEWDELRAEGAAVERSW